jgi:hypothetical protein
MKCEFALELCLVDGLGVVSAEDGPDRLALTRVGYSFIIDSLALWLG